MAAVEQARGRLDFGAVIRRVFGVIRRNIKALGLLALVFYLAPSAVVMGVRGMMGLPLAPISATGEFDSTGLAVTLVSSVLSLVGWSLVQIAVTKIAVADLNDRPMSFVESLRDAPGRILPVLGLTLVAGIGIVVGLILLIVPGLILMTVWLVSGPSLIVEKGRVFASLRRSRDLTRYHRWAVFGLMFVFLVVYYLLIGVTTPIMMSAMGSPNGANFALAILPSMIIGTIVVVLAAVGSAVIYNDLRTSKEGVGPEQLASVFD